MKLKPSIMKSIFFWLTIVCIYVLIMWVNLYYNIAAVIGIALFGFLWHKYDGINKAEKRKEIKNSPN